MILSKQQTYMSAEFYRIGVYMQATRCPNAFSSFIIYSVRVLGWGGGGGGRGTKGRRGGENKNQRPIVVGAVSDDWETPGRLILDVRHNGDAISLSRSTREITRGEKWLRSYIIQYLR